MERANSSRFVRIMTILFTEGEMKYINKNNFNWKVDEECPQNIKKTILLKLNLLKKMDESR